MTSQGGIPLRVSGWACEGGAFCQSRTSWHGRPRGEMEAASPATPPSAPGKTRGGDVSMIAWGHASLPPPVDGRAPAFHAVITILFRV